MQVEVDQSGKIEWTQKPTVLAFANGKHFSIFLSAQAKRAILKEVANRRPNRSRTMHRLLVFATLLYILLKDHVDNINLVKLDIEYTEHEATIREHVLNLFRRRKRVVNPD